MGIVNERPTICFSIVSHGHGKLVGQLLASIRDRQLIDPLRDLVIVTLNLEEDESFLLEGSSLPINIIRNKEPKGFGANHNAAFATCQSDLFCVLNPDLDLKLLELRFMYEALRDLTIGAWGPMVKSPNMAVEDSARKFPTLLSLFTRTFLNQRSIDYVALNEPIEVDWIAGMFISFRSTTFRMLCGFDESYHLYMEDVDICRRLKSSSLKVIYDPRTLVIHDARRDSRKNLKYLKWHVMSIMKYFAGSS